VYPSNNKEDLISIIINNTNQNDPLSSFNNKNMNRIDKLNKIDK
jgi:hypothetical protein